MGPNFREKKGKSQMPDSRCRKTWGRGGEKSGLSGRGAPISPSTEDCLCPLRRTDLGSFSKTLDFYKTLFLGKRKDLKDPKNGCHPFPADSSSCQTSLRPGEGPQAGSRGSRSHWAMERPQFQIPGLISNNPGDFSKTHTISLGLHFVISTRGHTPSACCMGLEPCD